MTHICTECQQSQDVIEQPKWNGGFITLVTCYNPDCDLSGVTLTPEQFAGLDSEQLEAYRTMVRNRKYQEPKE